MNRRRFLKHSALASSSIAVGIVSGHQVIGPIRRATSVAGRFVMVDVPGSELDAETRSFLDQYEIRAVCLFQRNVRSREQARRLVLDLAELMGSGALIAIDQEGGGVLRTEDLPFAPSAMSIGATGDAELAGMVGAATARGLRSMGINWNFAPVLDVNSNPLNPIIGDRSFGEDPELVAELGTAWMRGSVEQGVAASGKHFPGHGDTAIDSHLALPTVDRDRETLDRLDLYPFRKAAEAGIPAFMTSHIVFPAFDPELPATLSPVILTDLLRHSWNFGGVVVTDSMGMGAISRNYSRGEASVLAMQAGADMLASLGRIEDKQDTLHSVQAALNDGRIPASRAEASLRRLDALARRFPVRVRPYTREEEARDRELMVTAWTRGLCTYENPRPIPEGSPVVMVVADGIRGEQVSGRGLSGPEIVAMLREFYQVEPVYFAMDNPEASIDKVRGISRDGKTVILATTSRRRPEENFKRLIETVNPDLHMALWNPYAVLDVNAPALISYGFRPEALTAVISWMRGLVTAEGRIPVRLA